MSEVEEIITQESGKGENLQDILAAKLESWRDRLLDLGSRNALINTPFSERSNVIEFDTPSTQEIWRWLWHACKLHTVGGIQYQRHLGDPHLILVRSVSFS